jgi:hypothetical protein
MARKVVKDLLHKNFPTHYKKDIDPILRRYKGYYRRNQFKMNQLIKSDPASIKPILNAMGDRMLADYESQILDELVATHFTTDRVRSHFDPIKP